MTEKQRQDLCTALWTLEKRLSLMGLVLRRNVEDGAFLRLTDAQRDAIGEIVIEAAQECGQLVELVEP